MAEAPPASPLPDGYLARSFASASTKPAEATERDPMETFKSTAPFIGAMALIGALSSFGLLDF